VKGFESDFAEDGVHHDEETYCDWEGYTDELASLEGGPGGGDEVSEENADGHGEDYPDYEEAVEEGEAAEGRDGFVGFIWVEGLVTGDIE
jgi:hypothetical protein